MLYNMDSVSSPIETSCRRTAKECPQRRRVRTGRIYSGDGRAIPPKSRVRSLVQQHDGALHALQAVSGTCGPRYDPAYSAHAFPTLPFATALMIAPERRANPKPLLLKSGNDTALGCSRRKLTLQARLPNSMIFHSSNEWRGLVPAATQQDHRQQRKGQVSLPDHTRTIASLLASAMSACPERRLWRRECE